MADEKKQNITVTKKDTEAHIEGELPTEALEKHRDAATKHLGKDLELKGFRKGKVPAHMISEKIGEDSILYEMADRALKEELPKLFLEHKIDAIGRPDVSVTKLAANNPLGFKIETAILPEITLPDYKKIAAKHTSKKQEPIEISEKELDDALLEIRKRAHKAEQAANPKASETDARVNKQQDPSPASQNGQDEELPELTDDLIKKLGNYKDVAAFKEKLTGEMKTHKARVEHDKRRGAIIEDILKKVPTQIPDLLIESELGRMLARFQGEVEQVGMKFEDYLTQIKKTEDDLRKEWRGDAEKQAKFQLVLNEIAKKENITADPALVDAQVAHILASNKEANQSVTQASKTSVHIYVETILTNEAVLSFLEKDETKEEHSA